MLKDLHLPITVRFNLFDTYVASIMNYCCEIWCFSKSERFERNHNKFLKQTLGVKLTTSNYALFGETGQLPLCIKRNVRKVNLLLIQIVYYILYTVTCCTDARQRKQNGLYLMSGTWITNESRTNHAWTAHLSFAITDESLKYGARRRIRANTV